MSSAQRGSDPGGGLTLLASDRQRRSMFLSLGLVILRQQSHHFVGVVSPAEQISHQAHGTVDMGEEGFVRGAEIVQSRLTIGRGDEAVAWALAMAGEAHRTFTTIAGKSVALGEAERPLLVGGNHLDHMRLADIAQAIGWLDEVVAGIEVAVVLQCERLAACL